MPRPIKTGMPLKQGRHGMRFGWAREWLHLLRALCRLQCFSLGLATDCPRAKVQIAFELKRRLNNNNLVM